MKVKSCRASGPADRLRLLSALRIRQPCGALQLIPVEAAAIDGALKRFEQHHAEKLPISEALQPDVTEEPEILTVAGVSSLQREGGGRGQEVNYQEGEEEKH